MAATARVVDEAETAGLVRLGELVDASLLADLPETFAHVLARLDRQAAASTDVVHLMAALPPLVRTLRYGDVRGTDTGSLTGVVEALLARVCAGLPAAVGPSTTTPHSSCASGSRRCTRRWRCTSSPRRPELARHGAGARRPPRRRRPAGRAGGAAAARRRPDRAAGGRRAARPARCRGARRRSDRAAWVEGFLAGGGALLVHDRDLLALLDAWVCELAEQDFVDVLPLLRRTFGTFAAGERRQVADRVRQRPRRETPAGPHGSGWDVDDELGRPALLAVARLLGVAP